MAVLKDALELDDSLTSGFVLVELPTGLAILTAVFLVAYHSWRDRQAPA